MALTWCTCSGTLEEGGGEGGNKDRQGEKMQNCKGSLQLRVQQTVCERRLATSHSHASNACLHDVIPPPVAVGKGVSRPAPTATAHLAATTTAAVKPTQPKIEEHQNCVPVLTHQKPYAA